MNVRVSQLDNGLRVVSQTWPHLETATLGVWIKAGSRDEEPEQNGLAHFLEHMAFKGTHNRSAFEIVDQIEMVGGDLNAATGLDQTSYYASVLRPSVGIAVELIGDILINSTFPENEIARERQVIEQEILASHDQPEDVVFDLAQSLAFPDQPVGRPVMGTRASVGNFQADDLRAFMAAHYGAQQMVLCAVGAVDHDELCDLATQHLGGLPVGKAKQIVTAHYQGGIGASTSQFEQGHVVAGFEGLGFKSEEIFTAQILNYILGGGMSSRLFQEIREKRGLAYHVYGFHSTFEDTGFFGAYAATDQKSTVDVTDLIFSEIFKIATYGVTSKELHRAQAQLKSGLASVFESTGARAEQLARQMLFFDKSFEMAELIEKVETVSLDECGDLAQKLISKNNISVAVAGLDHNCDEFERFKSSSYFLSDPLQRHANGEGAKQNNLDVGA